MPRYDFGLLGNEPAMFEWAARQSYIALGNMMTSAALIGIDSCPIEGFDKAQAENALREEGLLAKGYESASMAAFGYRMNEPRAKTRRGLADIVEWVD
jgi:nitroreductase